MVEIERDWPAWRRESALQGIEFMTAWLGSGSTATFAGERMQAVEHEQGKDGVAKTLLGIHRVAADLLASVAELTGRPEQDLLQELALLYQNREF